MQIQTMKMTQLNLADTAPPIPDIFSPESDPRGRHLHGRPAGARGVVTEHRQVEAARMAVIGESLPVIAEQLGVGRTRAGQIVREAEESGMVDELSSARSDRVKKMAERRFIQATAAMDIVQARLDQIKQAIDDEDEGSLDARAVNDAFRAVDRTEYTVDGAAKLRGSATVHIDKLALFTPEAIQAAQADSDRVYGG